MKYSLTNSKFQRAFGRYFCRKNYFSTNHTWEFEECQIILKKSKKEAPTVIVSACKILYSFFSGKIIPVFICSIVQTCKLFYCKIFQWIFFIYHNSYSIFSNDFCFQKLCFIILNSLDDIAKSHSPLITAVIPLEESVAFTSISAFGFCF